MGWLFTNQSKSLLIEALTSDYDSVQIRSQMLAHYLAIDDVLWSVVKLTAKQHGLPSLCLDAGQSANYIRCDLLEGSTSGWGYKTIEEAMGPYYYSCPLAFLDMAAVQSQAWRNKVREYHRGCCC